MSRQSERFKRETPKRKRAKGKLERGPQCVLGILGTDAARARLEHEGIGDLDEHQVGNNCADAAADDRVKPVARRRVVVDAR